MHDPRLLDELDKLPTEPFNGDVFRATRKSLDPTTPSTAGGRLAPAGGAAVLYTSFERNGALAELAFHWAQLEPLPTRPALVHRLGVRSDRTLRLIRSSLDALGIDATKLHEPNYRRTQEIGAAVAFIGCDGLIAPSARWSCDNLILFTDNLAMEIGMETKGVEEVDWLDWAKSADCCNIG